MSFEVKLSDNIYPADVLNWPAPDRENLHFRLFKSAAFEPGAEGLALAYLGHAINTAKTIYLTCEYSPPDTENDFNGVLLSSIFGYALLRSSEKTFFGTSGQDLTNEFRQFSGNIYDLKKGSIGLGNKVSLIAFDPRRPVPRVLYTHADFVDQLNLPLPSAFQTEAVNILKSLGLTEVTNQSTFPILISFIYELFINTLQHGRPKDIKIAKFSTRGIAFSKITFSTQQLENRNISPDLKNFLIRISDIEKRDKDLSVVCISVMDMGDGIQNTLPNDPNNENENESERLLRAFQMGQTRKNSGVVERGLGLQKVLEAAHRLGARLQVSSAGRQLVKDFSFGDDKLPTVNGASITLIPPHLSRGTTVDLFIPNLSRNIDQRSLVL